MLANVPTVVRRRRRRRRGRRGPVFARAGRPRPRLPHVAAPDPARRPRRRRSVLAHAQGGRTPFVIEAHRIRSRRDESADARAARRRQGDAGRADRRGSSGVEHISSGDLLRAAVARGHAASGARSPSTWRPAGWRPTRSSRRRSSRCSTRATATCSTASRARSRRPAGSTSTPSSTSTSRTTSPAGGCCARGRADDSAAVIEQAPARVRRRTPSRSSTTTASAACWSQVDGDRPPDEITAELLQRLKPD